MESPSMYPTAADYANSNAQDAKRKAENLEHRLDRLEAKFKKLCSIVEDMSLRHCSADVTVALRRLGKF